MLIYPIETVIDVLHVKASAIKRADDDEVVRGNKPSVLAHREIAIIDQAIKTLEIVNLDPVGFRVLFALAVKDLPRFKALVDLAR